MLRLNIRPSRQLLAVLALSHGCAAICVLSVPLPLWLRSSVLIALLLNLVFDLSNQVWRVLPFSVVALEFEREGGVLMRLRNGESRQAMVLGSSFAAPYLTIVRLKVERAWFARNVVLLPDMLAPALFRTLRVWLKWRIGRGVAPDAKVDWTGTT